MPRNEGVYAKVLAERNLRPLPPEEPGRQAQVEEAKRKIEDREPTKLAERYIALRKEKADLELDLSAVHLEIAALEQLLTASQEAKAEGWGAYGVKDNALRLPTGDTIRVQKEPCGKVIDKETFRRWCIQNGYETKLQLWPSVMNAIVKERLLAGEAEPDGTEAFSYVKVVYAKGGTE